MATFGTMKTRLQLLLAQHLTLTDIGSLINRVHQEEVENHAWHRLKVASIINSVAPVSTGTVSITQDATAVTGVGTSFAAADVGKYIRINSDDTPLKIATRTSTTAITVEKAWAKASVSAVAYSLFPLRYALPSGAQKLNWIKRTLPLVEATIEDLNAADPNRTSTSDRSTHWAPVERDSTDLYQVELWPVNTSAVAYACEYLKGHTDLSATTDTPLVPSGVIENKALHDCTMALFLKSGDQKFFTAAQTYYQRYQAELTEATIRDRVQFGVASTLDHALTVDYDYFTLHDVGWG